METKREAQILRVLGVDPYGVIADTLTLEPFGASGWLIKFQSFRVLDDSALRELIAERPATAGESSNDK